MYYKEDEIEAYFPRIIENNTVGGKLVSIPLYTDAGILYYRTDLLEKYGYKEPPKTWEELAAMAKKIQDGERAAGKPDFQGFVFEGKASESVNCNALEWIYSYGGGSVIEPDKKVTITGADYNQLSTALFQNVNEVLTGAESGKDAVVHVERLANRIVH
ncbi:MAG TPA: extracellular solute-binding protein [Chthoniobacterales bacterium]|nr:extracellular solute-binding protein [Chthoniobacterales bacterium]